MHNLSCQYFDQTKKLGNDVINLREILLYTAIENKVVTNDLVIAE